MQKKGFTLAEVLITIGIIGVVAAMTLPTLIEKHKKAELQNALKAGYSQLQQALERMHADMGYTPTPQDFAARKFKEQYIKYFESPIDCQWGGVYASGNAKLCGKGTVITGESGSAELSDIYSIYNSTSEQKMSSTIIDDGQFALKNGMLVMIENVAAGALYITIDVNGINKRPNIWGYDVFTFQLMNDGKLLPMGAEGTAYPAETYCSTTSTNKFNGAGCTYKALTDHHYWDGI